MAYKKLYGKKFFVELFPECRNDNDNIAFKVN